MTLPAQNRHQTWLNDEPAYRRWRQQKLAAYPLDHAALYVDIRDPEALTEQEIGQLQARCRQYNFAAYRWLRHRADDQIALLGFAQQLGLQRHTSNLQAGAHGISTLEVSNVANDYIPYSRRALNWHTDGYYDPVGTPVRAFLLHCVRPAASGGTNALFDPDIAYILLRDRDPDWITALMQPDVITIPANRTAAGEVVRAACAGPVLVNDASTGTILMRYTARRKYVHWKPDPLVTAAIRHLESVLDSESPWTVRLRLEHGHGIVCNNVLHARSAFKDSDEQARRVYRIRYQDRVS
ncbi:MAG: TauD/TfdA family dioxygenase [Gammaproteobacteria bacterium]|nr:TauD/TfdA family dioxygenase [Gammaproteobacteria bacterium]